MGAYITFSLQLLHSFRLFVFCLIRLICCEFYFTSNILLVSVKSPAVNL